MRACARARVCDLLKITNRQKQCAIYCNKGKVNSPRWEHSVACDHIFTVLSFQKLPSMDVVRLHYIGRKSVYKNSSKNNEKALIVSGCF